jgi:hypothetical protein
MQKKLTHITLTSLFALCGLLLLTWQLALGQRPRAEDQVGHPPKYAIFTFPSDVAVAEILDAEAAPSHNGQAKLRWGRVLAQGRVRLPTNSELQINVRFDGLERLDQLKQLSFCKVGCFSASELDFEDRHIHYLQSFKDLRNIDLRDTLITDKSLAQIGLFPKLGILNLLKTNVTGIGFDSLKNLHNLFDLNIEGTSLKPGNIFKLRPLMPKLVGFSLARTSISKADAAILKDLKAVQMLTLSSNSHIDNDCVKYLSDLKELSVLNIDDTSITDKSIPLLIKLPKLREVKVRPKAFWKTKEHLNKYGKVDFIDIEHFSGAPADVFGPLH